jgi:hypothetical protein
MFGLTHCATFTPAKLQKVISILVETVPRIAEFFKTVHYVLNMSGSALVPWEVSSTQAPITDRTTHFTFACTTCYFATHPTVHFLPSRKFV